jgi:hypothetical protein
MKTLKVTEINDFLETVAGDVSYISDANFMGTKTTASVKDGRWTSKRFARDVMNEIKESERKATYVAPVTPALKPSVRSAPYAGPFPRGKHSHRCATCGDAVACYKSKCTRPQHTSTCPWCANRA